MSLPNSAGELANGVAPRSVSRAAILGSAKAALISRLSWSTTFAGVPWGAQKPPQIGAALVEAFRVEGVDIPRAIVTTSDGRLRDTLLASGQYLTTLPESVLRFSRRLSSFKVLPVDLPTTRGPTSITTVKNRELSPVARLFIECLREVARPLAKGRR